MLTTRRILKSKSLPSASLSPSSSSVQLVNNLCVWISFHRVEKEQVWIQFKRNPRHSAFITQHRPYLPTKLYNSSKNSSTLCPLSWQLSSPHHRRNWSLSAKNFLSTSKRWKNIFQYFKDLKLGENFFWKNIKVVLLTILKS